MNATPLPETSLPTWRKLYRSAAFRLTLIYVLIFAVFAFLLLGYVAWNARRLIDQQIASTISAEVTGLAEQHRIGGMRRLVMIIEQRVREPGASIYLVTTPFGERLAGNVDGVPPGTLDRPGEMEITYRRNADGEIERHRALVQVFVLPAGFRVLVGRDLEERERLRHVIRRAGGWSLLLVLALGCFGGWFVARRVLKRVDGMTETARTLMSGDLKGRLAVQGSGDEFDRLALNLNAMLDRIGALMQGLTQVSDNVAHDLKTPLTRLRNRAEAALRRDGDVPALKASLQGVIDDADGLIRVFNALLMIARLEAGQAREAMGPVAVTELVESVCELYEPLAEEQGLTLVAEIAPDMSITGNRELIGQALSNLVDNAIKYGKPAVDAAPGQITVRAATADGQVLLSVTDRGEGIPAADRARVTERFVRLDGSRSKPGFGLGLALVAAVAKLHGGEIRLDDAAPGLAVTLRLPSAPASIAQPVA